MKKVHCPTDRIKILSQYESQYTENTIVVYWMSRELRVQDNWSLQRAMEVAKLNAMPLIVLYNMEHNYLGGGARATHWKLLSLVEVEKSLSKYNIPLIIVSGDAAYTTIPEFCEKHNVAHIVTDFDPLRGAKKWRNYVIKNTRCTFEMVDSHNCVPVWITSSKQEFSARTIRPKLWRMLPSYITQIPQPTAQSKAPKISKKYTHSWSKLFADYELDIQEKYVCGFIPGEKAAHTKAKNFVEESLEKYAFERNNANNKQGQSGLSPYLHYGNISAHTIVQMILEKTGKTIQEILPEHKNTASNNLSSSASAFIEELITRKELSDNFCYYNDNYDSFEGLPSWSQKTLNQARSDKRDYIYSYQEFRDAKTHDPLWNSAQNEMVVTGKMHGYMRMYWAKKILEWSESPEIAIKNAIRLNDSYELDGRDPNGYVGILWSIGGLHDRAWFPRKIFGTVRYMAESGCKKHFDTKHYIAQWSTITPRFEI